MGIVFLTAGARKLYGWEWAMNTYLQFHPLWVYYFSAVVEVVTGIGLLIPRLRFAAGIGQLLLIAWVTFYPPRGIDPNTIVSAIVTTVLLVTLVLLTRPRRHAAGK
jgi:uncharacterized membrane protein YphA (DoxX/SURF4 family)